MLWRKGRGDFTALHIITRWSTIFMILGSTKDGNGLVTLLQDTIPTNLIQTNVHSKVLLSNSLGNSNIVNRQSSLKNSFYIAGGVSAGANQTNLSSNKNLGLNNKLSEKEINNNHLLMDDKNTSSLQMYFSTENATHVTYQVGSVALVPCSIHHIPEEITVSWIRRKDYHLLTVGSTTYSSDERFSAIHLQQSEDWTLQIKFVQMRDAGVYECQVSTHPPTSIFIHLNVVEARAEIPGPIEKYLKPGSTLRLNCKVLQSMESPLYLFWYHNNRMINYDLHRGVNVSTEPDNRYSELLISQTSLINSGNYSCVPSNAVPASVIVHILIGENPAAMQHGEHGNGICILPSVCLLILNSFILQIMTK